MWQGVEGVLICHLAQQVKLESSESVRGRGINNTKGLQRERQREKKTVKKEAEDNLVCQHNVNKTLTIQ